MNNHHEHPVMPHWQPRQPWIVLWIAAFMVCMGPLIFCNLSLLTGALPSQKEWGVESNHGPWHLEWQAFFLTFHWLIVMPVSAVLSVTVSALLAWFERIWINLLYGLALLLFHIASWVVLIYFWGWTFD